MSITTREEAERLLQDIVQVDADNAEYWVDIDHRVSDAALILAARLLAGEVEVKSQTPVSRPGPWGGSVLVSAADNPSGTEVVVLVPKGDGHA